MATVNEVLGLIRGFAPEEYGYKKEYDNIGLMVGDGSDEVTRVVCCLDATTAVINEAVKLQANLIISHHPLIWNPLKSVTADTVDGKRVLLAARNGINIYAAHTNLDFTRDGINEYLANAIGLRNVVPLDPYISAELGFGRVGDLSNKVFCSVLKGEIESILKDNHVRIIGEPLTQIKRVAVINGGAGGDTAYIDMAKAAGADCLVTADVRHHVAVYAYERGLTVIEPQHFNTEYVYIARLVQILRLEAKSSKLNIEIVQAASETNPRF
ncbi:MAG: Nif3-like dinuclear metal center hexameric protein [Clostridiales bacterium]|jgi:dinuclear metal center YbgI/SA1388 family protein|nr:Nif3-like dinuclear metal center hexameric protein [Clostridiales bacterium]